MNSDHCDHYDHCDHCDHSGNYDHYDHPQITNTPGYMAVRLGRFQLCSKRVETLQKQPPKSEPFSRFQLTLLPDLLIRKHKNNKNNRYRRVRYIGGTSIK